MAPEHEPKPPEPDPNLKENNSYSETIKELASENATLKAELMQERRKALCLH